MRTLTASLAVATVALTVTARTQDQTIVTSPAERFTMRVLASGLEAPWELTWGPDDQLWVTERKARRVVRVNPADGARRTALTAPEIHQSVSQDGLLGLALHPGLLRGTGADYVYVAFTYDDGPGPALERRMGVRRYRYDQATGTLVEPVDILTGLPTHDDHVGGRLEIGPDLKLYLSIGDQGSNFGQNRCNPNRAQATPTSAAVAANDWSTYAGKVLRIDLDGAIPADNPVIEGTRSHVFSVGHRNPLGLAFGPTGLLYESEHGPSTDDEVNLIEAGRNYGWPNVAGYRDDKSYVYANWSASTPAPCASLPPGSAPPPSVPSQLETAWSHPQFAPPLRTFFTVDTGYPVRGIGGATIAPGGIDVYSSGVIPGWRASVLALSLIRGVVYRLPLAADGRSVVEPPRELFPAANRYRDIALDPNGRTIYLATDVEGPSRDGAGTQRPLEHPGSILAFTYEGASARVGGAGRVPGR
jgi:PQQ-dependent dehydrogenase (s-GDH family)